MSDIPQARQLITEVLQLTGVDQVAKLRLQEALALMWRKGVEPEEIPVDDQFRLPARGM